jgi:hypothetical protein
MFRMAAQLRAIRASYQGTDTAWADHYFYDFNDLHSSSELSDSPRRVAGIAAKPRRNPFPRALRDGARD